MTARQAHTSHGYLAGGLHAACSAMPCDVYPTSDILLAKLAHHSASRISTAFFERRATM